MTRRIRTGARPHRLTLTTPGADISDGLGGFTPGPPTVVTPIFGHIVAASARSAERILPALVTASASHLVTFPYVAGVTLRSALTFHDPDHGDRTFTINGIVDRDERHIELVIACEEAK